MGDRSGSDYDRDSYRRDDYDGGRGRSDRRGGDRGSVRHRRGGGGGDDSSVASGAGGWSSGGGGGGGDAAARREERRRKRKAKAAAAKAAREGRAAGGGGAGGGAGASGRGFAATASAVSHILDAETRRSMALTRRAGHVDANLAQPEVHIIGEIVGGEGFGKGVSCKFVVQTGPAWKFLQGNQSGQTQVDYPAGGGKLAVWAHPLDLHYTTLTTEGWPRLLVQVWQLDSFGRNQLRGYGFVHLPSGAGSFDVEVPTWRPVGTPKEEMLAFFVGGYPQLKDTNVLYSHARDRFRLVTEGSGTVHVHVEVVVKNFSKDNVEW